MRHRIGLVLCILVGSFCVYCGQSVMTNVSHDGGGPVGDAMGDSATCCTPPAREAPTVLFDGPVAPTPISGTNDLCTMMTPVLDVSPYRTIVVHSGRCAFVTQFRNGKAGFVLGPTNLCPASGPDSLVPVMMLDSLSGHDLRVNFGDPSPATPDGEVGCAGSSPIAVTIVGYRNP